MPHLLALDQSLAETGFAVLDMATEHVVAHGTIPTRKTLPIHKRLAIIAAALLELIRQHAPTELAIERPFVGHNRMTALTLGAVRGVLLYLAEDNALRICEYTPSQIKSAVTSASNAGKPQVLAMIRRLTGLPIHNDNESDAIAVGLTHLHSRWLGSILRPTSLN